MQIAENTFVSIEYILKDESGSIIDQSAGRGPLSYVQGRGEVVPGLERALEGKRAGDELSVSLIPEDAYGVYDEALTFEVPRSSLPPNIDPRVGLQLFMSAPTGSSFR